MLQRIHETCSNDVSQLTDVKKLIQPALADKEGKKHASYNEPGNLHYRHKNKIASDTPPMNRLTVWHRPNGVERSVNGTFQNIPHKHLPRYIRVLRYRALTS